MRRLTIGWRGTSRALDAIRQMLEQYGHGSGDEAIDLWIEDGSQPLPAHCAEAACISLRLGVGPLTDYGLPALQLRAYGRDRRVSAVLNIAEEPSGNGQRLRAQATDALVDWVVLQVSGFSRDAESLSTRAIATDWAEQDLHGLEALAYTHRFNRTADPALIREAQIPVIERVQASLAAFAERPALSFAEHAFTYRQLHIQAMAIQQQLHPLLAALEAPPVVGVCLEKSIELYASLLALLGCGAVYLPLAPDQPVQRHQTMLESAGANVLLDAGSHPLRSQFVSLDVSAVAPHNAETASPLMPHRPCMDAPCMILFTSGSTGHPKGVLLSQGNLAHFTAWFSSCMTLDERSRVLQFSPVSFDSSLIDIFPALIAGAELIVPSQEQRRDPHQLAELLRRRHVTHAFVPPALLSLLPLAPLWA